MDFFGSRLGKVEAYFGMQLCAYCADGPEKLARVTIGVSGGGRGKNGTVGHRRLEKPLTDEELQLWALQWLAERLNDMANQLIRTGRIQTWY